MKSINLKIKTSVGLLLWCATSISVQAQDTLMYRGGFHDGYSMLSQNNYTPTLLAGQSMYLGASGDGYSKSDLQNHTPTLLASQAMYLGNSGDGYAQLNIQNFSPSIIPGQAMYLGNSGDGHAYLNVQNFSRGYLPHYGPYAGGSGDGHAEDTTTTFNPGYLTHFTPYAGGEGDGYAGLLIVNAVTPINLLAFDGKIVQNGNLLDWKVVATKGRQEFQLQKSADAERFQTIHTKVENASGDFEKTYNYLDTEPFEGNNYYRLAMIDEKQKLSYSHVVLLVYRKDDQSLSVFPNPTQQNLNLQYKLNAKAEMRILDVKGSLIKTQSLQEGNHTISIPVEHLAQGVYLLQVVSESGINKSIRFMKQ